MATLVLCEMVLGFCETVGLLLCNDLSAGEHLPGGYSQSLDQMYLCWWSVHMLLLFMLLEIL